MSPLPVISNCFRVALNGGLYGGVRAINVFHVLTDEDDVTALADAILSSAEQPGMLGGRPESGKPATISITPLDGVSGSSDFACTGDQFPTDTGDGQMVPEACYAIKFATGLRGPANRGRLFNGPLVESVIANGEVDSSICDGTQGAWQNFATALGANTPSIGLAVASYKNEEAHTITAITVPTMQCTQRRRLLQTR